MFVDGTTDFEMTRGDSETIGVKLKNYELKAGDTVYLTVRKRPKSEDVVFQKVVTEFDNGRVDQHRAGRYSGSALGRLLLRHRD